jgi:AraC-like DNA-binding protein
MASEVNQNRVRVRRIDHLDHLEVLHACYHNHTFPRHTHMGYAFGVIEAGALGFYYRGVNLVAPAGCINLVLPDEVHTGYPAGGEGWTYRMLYLQSSTLGRVMRELGGGTAEQPYFTSGVIRDDDLAERLRIIHRLLEQPGLPRMEQEYWLNDFLVRMVQRHASNRPAARHSGGCKGVVTLVKSYLEENYPLDISIDDLCQLTHLTRFHLVHLFSQAAGIPPHAYQRQVRLQHAKEFLSAGYSITAAAAAAGFADQSHLTRWFKRVWGFTPGEYSNSVQYV